MDRQSGLPPRSLEEQYLEIVLQNKYLRQSAALYAPLDAIGREVPRGPHPRELDLDVWEDLGVVIESPVEVRSRAREDEAAAPQRFEDIQSAFGKFRRVVVLGEPGAGKSTALQRLAYLQAQAAVEDPDVPLPLYVRLGFWERPEVRPVDFLMAQVRTLAEAVPGYDAMADGSAGRRFTSGGRYGTTPTTCCGWPPTPTC